MQPLFFSFLTALRSVRWGAIAIATAIVSALSLSLCFGFAQPVNATGLTWAPNLPLASLFHFSGSRPKGLGIQAGHLKACPSSPNCVSSQGEDPEHFIEAIATTDPPVTLDGIVALIQADDAAEIITQADDYLYAEYTSSLMGFVDDVEFWIDAEAGEIAVRSASRLGESDLGVNRKRIEAIRAAL